MTGRPEVDQALRVLSEMRQLEVVLMIDTSTNTNGTYRY